MHAPKLPTILAATAIAVSVFGATPLGQAASSVILPKNSVGAKQLQRNAVTGFNVKNHSLMAADFKAGQLPAGPQGLQGEKGDNGAQGAKGDKGDKGDAGRARHQRLRGGRVDPADAGCRGPGERHCIVSFGQESARRRLLDRRRLLHRSRVEVDQLRCRLVGHRQEQRSLRSGLGRICRLRDGELNNVIGTAYRPQRAGGGL
jgi:hypothetical protein